jgi:hypothetical protein
MLLADARRAFLAMPYGAVVSSGYQFHKFPSLNGAGAYLITPTRACQDGTLIVLSFVNGFMVLGTSPFL